MVRKRGRGKKNPRGETKASIILYLTESEEGTRGRQDIIDYLREKHNIWDAKTIDGHLIDLSDEELIKKKEIRAGLPVSYHLASGYSGLKKIFQFTAENNKELDLLKSPYIQTTIDKKIFPEITRDVLKAIGYRLYRIAIMNEAELEVDQDFGKIFVRMKKEASYASLKERFDKPGITKLRNLLQEKLKSVIGTSDDINERNKAIKYVVDEFVDILNVDSITPFLFPLNEQDDIINVLKSSPSALSLVLTIQDEGIKRSMPLLVAYAGYYVQFIIRISKNIDIEDKELKAERFTILIEDFLQGRVPRGSASTPILIILKSLLISDLFSSRVVGSDWVMDYCTSLLGLDSLLREQPKKIGEKPPEASP